MLEEMTMEAAPVQKPSWLSANISLGNFLTLIVLIGGGFAAFNRMQFAIESSEIWRAEYDKRIEKLETKVAPMENLTFRLGQQEASLGAMNARVDRAVDAITDQLKELRKDVGSVNTSIAVLTRSIEGRSRSDDLSAPKVIGPR